MKHGETLVHKRLKQEVARELRSKGYNVELDISFSELVFRAIEEYRNNTVLIPIQKDVEELMRFYRGDLSYSEFIRGLIKSCVGV